MSRNRPISGAPAASVPQGTELAAREQRGAIAYMARNRVAASLLLLAIVVPGVFSARNLVLEVFPEVSLGVVSVSVAYPGATPDEMEEAIVVKIEEQIEGVDGVREISSTAAEGLATVSAQVRRGADVSRVLDDIKARVDRIQTFPQGAERPEVFEVTNQQSSVQLVIYGDVPERALKEVALLTEQSLSARPEISYVEVSGVRDYELSVLVSQARLKALGLSLADVAAAIRAGSLELSAGSIDTESERVRIRSTGKNYTQEDFERIIVVSRSDGTIVRLGQIADVRDGFEEGDRFSLYQGKPAAYVDVFRTSDENAIEILEVVRRHLDEAIVPGLPAGVEIDIGFDLVTQLESRLGLMLKNGLFGLILVMGALWLFLDTRLAFWVSAGIAVAFVGALVALALLDVSLNVFSITGFIMAIGIVVDDAIVVSENIHVAREMGLSRTDASIRGAQRVVRPVVLAVLTTMVAFAPLTMVPGPVGAIMADIPLVVIAVVAVSLIESLLILPHHLAASGARRGRGAPPAPLARFKRRINNGLQRFIDGPLDRTLRYSTAHPGLVIAGATGLLVVSLAAVPAGLIQVVVSPAVESDVVSASLEMPEGTPAERTHEIARRIEADGHEALARALEATGEDAESVLKGVTLTIGEPPRFVDGLGNQNTVPLPNVGSIQFRLTSPEERDLSAFALEDLWIEEVGSIPEARSLTITSEFFSLGAPVHVELSHDDPARLAASGDSVIATLRTLAGVYNVRADHELGNREMRLNLLPAGRTLGITLDDLASQVRAAFFGVEAVRVQRGSEEVRVLVRLPDEERNSIGDVEDYLVRVPGGGEVALRSVASVEFDRSPSVIRRNDGRRALTVTAAVDVGTTSSREATDALEASILPRLAAADPDFSYAIGGEQRELGESLGALGVAALLAILAIYALLAIPFPSYTKPLIIMAAIPFGLIGALLGHLLLGVPLAVISLFAVIGLTGLIVNDSLVLVDFIHERQRAGMPTRQAIIEGAKSRFRPIFLTSLTTFLGILPLILERSVQAQFLVPMAAALGFGVLFATPVLMMLVPALASIPTHIGSRATLPEK